MLLVTLCCNISLTVTYEYLCCNTTIFVYRVSPLDLLPKMIYLRMYYLWLQVFFYLLSDNKDMQWTISQIALVSNWGHRNRRDLQKFISKALKHCMGYIIPRNKNCTFCDKRYSSKVKYYQKIICTLNKE